MKALVLGHGRSGKAAETLLCRSGYSVTVLDGEAVFPEGCFDFVLVSPGIALTHSWIVEATRRGIPLKSELQLGCEELKRRGWKLLAVTGSKGKSSVVKVVADAVNLAGGRAVPCGNYGLPVSEVANSNTQTLKHSNNSSWAIVEVSSFMMETTTLPPDTFEAAAILNLQEDHLDRHGSVEVYHGLKRKLLRFAARNFVNDGLSSEHRSIGASEHLWKGSYFDNEILRDNARVAAELMRVTGLDDAKIAAAFKDFEPLPHRMNLVAEFDGIRCIDDSKATSIAALIAGVKMASATHKAQGTRHEAQIRLIAGGLPKGDDPTAACPTLTERVRKVYLIGQSAEAFCAAWKGSVDCEICGTLDRAVKKALCEAGKDETVLLSPGTASFDQFKSYGVRGDVFANLVKKERQNR